MLVYPCYVFMLLFPNTKYKVTLAKREILIAKTCHIETWAEYFQTFVKAMEVHIALSFNITHLCLPLCQLPFCQWWEGRPAAGSWHHALLYPCKRVLPPSLGFHPSTLNSTPRKTLPCSYSFLHNRALNFKIRHRCWQILVLRSSCIFFITCGFFGALQLNTSFCKQGGALTWIPASSAAS